VKICASKCLAGFAFALLTAGAALAQSDALQAKIPFDFIVGDKHMEAGVYAFRITNASVLMLRSEDGRSIQTAFTFGTLPGEPDKGKLVFTRYGDEYFLTRAYWPGYEGRELPRSNRERELIARSPKPKESNVNVAATSVSH
jgi:hypothetical protein